MTINLFLIRFFVLVTYEHYSIPNTVLVIKTKIGTHIPYSILTTQDDEVQHRTEITPAYKNRPCLFCHIVGLYMVTGF